MTSYAPALRDEKTAALQRSGQAASLPIRLRAASASPTKTRDSPKLLKLYVASISSSALIAFTKLRTLVFSIASTRLTTVCATLPLL